MARYYIVHCQNHYHIKDTSCGTICPKEYATVAEVNTAVEELNKPKERYSIRWIKDGYYLIIDNLTNSFLSQGYLGRWCFPTMVLAEAFISGMKFADQINGKQV